MENMREHAEVIKEYLEQKGIMPFCDDRKGLVAVKFNDAGVAFQVSDEVIELQSYPEIEVSEEAYHEVLEYLNKVNSIFPEVCSEIDPETGICFRVTSCVEKGTTVQVSQIEQMLDVCSVVGGILFEGVKLIMDDVFNAEEAFELTMEVVQKLAGSFESEQEVA